MQAQILLQEITAISKKYDLLNQKTGGYFNVFEISNISMDEVIVCRMICELLSPTGSHYQGSLYLKLFLEYVLKLDISASELAAAQVYREYVIKDNRRIDLVIKTSRRFIPIEVKIRAGEQEEQCFAYYQEAKKYMSRPTLFYLTRFGDNPSEYSAKGLTKTAEGYEEIKTISFSEDVLVWLEQCVKQTETLKIAPIREILLQFMSVIRKFTNQMENEKEMEIKELLLSSSDNMRSALAIQSSLNAAKAEQMTRLFLAIEEKVGKEKLQNEYDYAYDNFKKIHDFYQHRRSTYPGISYAYKNEVKKDVDVWVRIEIDWNIFVGYCCPVRQKAGEQPLTNDEIKSVLKKEPCTENWWAYWEYCPSDSEKECPNFKTMNDAWIELFDKEKFDAFVERCAQMILSLLNR